MRRGVCVWNGRGVERGQGEEGQSMAGQGVLGNWGGGWGRVGDAGKESEGKATIAYLTRVCYPK